MSGRDPWCQLLLEGLRCDSTDQERLEFTGEIAVPEVVVEENGFAFDEAGFVNSASVGNDQPTMSVTSLEEYGAHASTRFQFYFKRVDQ